MEGKIFKRSIIFLVVFGCFVFGFFAEAQTPPLAIEYAPNLWFDSEEQYYPANPLDFYFENGQEIEGEKAVEKYNQLSLQEKLDNLIVFYHIKDEGAELVYQYWFFYVLNDYQTGVRNKHYGDWEAVYVFVDKQSSQVNKVIGTAHQRKLFDTEIYNPGINHVWSYIGSGSHANCVNEESNGVCGFFMWDRMEVWDRNGPKILYNDYNLIEISPDFIDNFKGAITLEKSSKLGINIFDFVKVENKELYIPWGGNPSTYAWEQSSYNNPEEVRPISYKLVTEYVSNKVNQAKDKVVGFFNDVFKQVEPEEQEAGIVTLLDVLPSVENQPELEIKEISEESRTFLAEQRTSLTPVIKEEVIEIKEVIKIEEIEVIEKEQPVITPSPIAPPTFISGGGAYIPLESEPEPEPEIIDLIPPSDIIDLSAIMGSNRGEIILSWTAPGADQYIIKYSTSLEITSFNWASSTDIISEPSPGLASSTENLVVSNLNTNQVYYWAMKSQDAAGNLSGISNSAFSSPYAPANSLVISEIQVKGNSLADDEFIELYNPTGSMVDLSNWSIQYRGSESESFIKNDFVGGNSVPAHGYFLITNSSYDGHMVADMSHDSFQMSDVGGSIFLVNNQDLITNGDEDSIIDKVAYGSGTYLFAETSEFSSMPDLEQSLERKNNSVSTAVSLAVGGDQYWQGNNWDGNDNSQDFVLQTSPSPQNSLSLTEPRSYFASLADIDWPMLQGNLQHTGLSSYSGNATGSPTSTPEWIANLGTIGPNEPIIGLDGSIYVGTGDGKLHKITTAGATSTFYSIGINGNVEAPVIASDGTIYMTDSKDLYALTSDGQVIWKYPTYGFSAPVIASDGTIYIASSYYLYALTPNGQKIWQSPQLSNGRWIMSPVLDSNGNIYTVGKIGSCSACQVVYALDPLDGGIIWQTDPGSYYTALSLDDSGTLYVGSFTGSPGLYAINTSDGSQKWHAPIIGNILESIPAIYQDVIYVGTYHNNTFYSVNKSDGNVNWTYYFGDAGGKISAAPIIDNQGVIYIGSTSGMFYAINPDGSLKWLAELSAGIESSAVIDSNGVVYVGSADGNIYAFGE